MGLKEWIQPPYSAWFLSAQREQRLREAFERRRRTLGEPHQVHYFHQVDDPYSALVVQVLARFAKRYDVVLCPHIVSEPSADAAPERDKLQRYSRADAELLATRWQLRFSHAGCQPDAPAVQAAQASLIAAIEDQRFIERVVPVTEWLWKPAQRRPSLPAAFPLWRQVSPERALAHREAADRKRLAWGHYLGGTFHYGGEWYWGLDRLHHLERRLQALGARRSLPDDTENLLVTPPDETTRERLADGRPPIDFFFSLRSPYSALAAPRVVDLARRTGVSLRLRYVMPMLMRGLPVTPAKQGYVLRDAAREARYRDLPFGRVCDPLGSPADRGLALMPLAEHAGVAKDYLLSFMRGVWAEGLDAGSDRGLRTIAERAGLEWAQARHALDDPAWRIQAEMNRAEMASLGLWGVPSFRVRTRALWGQDRLWAVEQALFERWSCA